MFLLDFIFPKRCVICQKNGSYICVDCFNSYLRIPFIPKCHICGHETRVDMVHNECKQYSYLDGLVYVTTYNSIVKKLIKLAKYDYVYSVMQDLGEIMGQFLMKSYEFNMDILTFVPLSRYKYRFRGFNQTEILSRSISSKTNIMHENLLDRVKNTETQVGMSEESRKVNLRDAFKVRKGISLNNLNVMVVDDIYTTGSTLNEIAKVLKQNGASTVYGFTFAKRRG